jgi:saccharopine dehydrogenase (NADP+, L-glutamate forming)
MKKILVLGAGLVARPGIRYLLESGYKVTVASRYLSDAKDMIGDHPHGDAHALEIKDTPKLTGFIKDHDITLSLVPPAFHAEVASRCIDMNRPMVTTSYVSPEMQALDGRATAAGLTILNEIGVDPGLDHMSAMRIIDNVKSRGGTVVSLWSYCGGLPTHADNTNPFGYKFSWAPRGVLLASRNGARYLKRGRTVLVQPERLFRDMHVLQVEDCGDYEAYPNRDSISYRDVYGLEDIGTLYRGTLRNIGWCDCMFHFRKLGLLELEELDVTGKTYADLMRQHLGAGEEEDLLTAAARKMGLPKDSLPVRNMEWLGMFSSRTFDVEKISLLDAMGALMFERLAFKPGERDMIILYHDFTANYPDGTSERITSRLIDFGIKDGDSSMSRTVSLPAAIGAHMLLSGKITTPGVLRPVTPEIYNPVLDELVTLDIECKKNIEVF